MAADDSGAVITNETNPMTQVTSPIEGIEVTSEDIFNLPSPQMTPHHMLALYQRIKEAASHFDGIVITHGTDTLEETAYFLDTMELPEISVVITGAMRSSNELGSDGVYNFLTALRVAADPKARDKGVLVRHERRNSCGQVRHQNPHYQCQYLSDTNPRPSGVGHEKGNPLL